MGQHDVRHPRGRDHIGANRHHDQIGHGKALGQRLALLLNGVHQQPQRDNQDPEVEKPESGKRLEIGLPRGCRQLIEPAAYPEKAGSGEIQKLSAITICRNH